MKKNIINLADAVSKYFMICSLILQGLFFTIPVIAQSSKGINFTEVTSWDEVLQKAKKEKKCIFVDVFATWCGPCKVMDKEVYTDPAVGELFNQKFISVKVQMDTSVNDNANVKGFYRDAKLFAQKYKILGYPTYLFFDLNGTLLNRDIGLQSINNFLMLGQVSADPDRQYLKLISAYRAGKRDYLKLMDLVTIAKKLGNRKLSDSVAMTINNEYLNRLQENEILNKTNLVFYSKILRVARSSDLIFKLAVLEPLKIDSVLGKGYSDHFVSTIVIKEEIQNKLWNEDQPVTKNPNWRLISKTIQRKYPNLDAEKIVLKEKVSFLGTIKDWKGYALAKTEFLNRYPVDPKQPMAVFMELNKPAWDLFGTSGDRVVLIEALKWSELSIALQPDPKDHIQYLDTRANLLYRLGRAQEAIQQEERALDLALKLEKEAGRKAFLSKDYSEMLRKMKAGLPTWAVPESNPVELKQ